VYVIIDFDLINYNIILGWY